MVGIPVSWEEELGLEVRLYGVCVLWGLHRNPSSEQTYRHDQKHDFPTTWLTDGYNILEREFCQCKKVETLNYYVSRAAGAAVKTNIQLDLKGDGFK